MAGAAARIAAELRTALRRARNVVALEVHAALVEATPVDTGWARANWIPSTGAPVASPDGSRESVTAGAQAAGTAQVAGFTGAGPVFVSNAVPYIEALDAGHSQQAPSGFVRASVEKGLAAARAKLGGGP